ncbi:MAG TPA: hypothetical protein VIN59_01215 [Alphaproteobacteria bacterium]
MSGTRANYVAVDFSRANVVLSIEPVDPNIIQQQAQQPQARAYGAGVPAPVKAPADASAGDAAAKAFPQQQQQQQVRQPYIIYGHGQRAAAPSMDHLRSDL